MLFIQLDIEALENQKICNYMCINRPNKTQQLNLPQVLYECEITSFKI